MKTNLAAEKDLYARLKGMYPTAIITPHSIRLETNLQNTTQTYSFDLLQRTGENLTTEKVINKNDTFVMFKSKLCMFAYSKTAKDEAVQVLQSYPNPIVFPPSLVPADFNVNHLEIVYNGKLSISKGSVEIIEALDTASYREVPQTQQTSALNRSQMDGDTGFIEMNPNIMLLGREQMDIQVQFPSIPNLKWQYPALEDLVIRLAFIGKGYLIKGASR